VEQHDRALWSSGYIGDHALDIQSASLGVPITIGFDLKTCGLEYVEMVA
jgi:hypothetical protein